MLGRRKDTDAEVHVKRIKTSLLLAGALALCGSLGCHEDGERPPAVAVDAGLPAEYVIGLLMNVGAGGDLGEIEFTVQKINELGGVLGQVPLAVRYVDLNGRPLDEVVAEARALFADPEVIAVIGPETTTQMMAVAPLAIEARKPLIAYKPTSSDILRAFAGSPYIWRTKPSDIFQIEWIVRHARAEGVRSLGLVTSVEKGARSAFDWFGFKTRAEGFADGDVHIEVYGPDRTCTEATEAILATAPERLVVAATERDDLTCIVDVLHRARTPDGALPTQVIVADLGPNVSGDLDVLGERAVGLEGWISTHLPETGLEEEFGAFRESGPPVPEHALGPPSDTVAGHDAIILIVHGLEVSGGEGGKALAEGIQTAVTGSGVAHGAHADGLQRTMEALRAGEPVDIVGAGGALSFDPDAGIDLLAGTLGYWRYDDPGSGFQVLEYVRIGADGEPPPNILDGPGAESFVAPGGPTELAFEPAEPLPRATKALIVTASAGWDNYRHQADALARYQLLKARGLTDDDIIMIGADDIADHPDNALPGQVRNVPGGPDVYAGVVYDYGIEVTPRQLADIIAGRVTDAAPTVLELDARTNLYVYLAGHGGLIGVVFGAENVEQGLTGSGLSIYEPAMLRDSLCALRAADGVRRVLVEVESCHAGVFGDAGFFGIESGCGAEPLSGVAMLTAASTRENSLGHGYDYDLAQWVGDEFSRRVLDRIERGDDPTLLDLYRDTYLQTAGSHAQLYNAAVFGDIGAIRPVSAFLSAPDATP